LILFTTEIELKTTRNSGGKLPIDRSTTTFKIQGELRRFEFKTDLIINWIYPIKTHGERLGASLCPPLTCERACSGNEIGTAHEKHACLNQNWKYAYFTGVKYELSSAHEKHGV
jgi:hypothetical protein